MFYENIGMIEFYCISVAFYVEFNNISMIFYESILYEASVIAFTFGFWMQVLFFMYRKLRSWSRTCYLSMNN